MRLPWLLTALLSATLLAGLQIFATENFIYWKYRWFDTPMHVLGGFTIAVFLIGLLGSTHRPRFFIIAAATIFVGWEVFEYIAKLTESSGYVLDTIHDLVNDTLGATLAFLAARETIWRSR